MTDQANTNTGMAANLEALTAALPQADDDKLVALIAEAQALLDERAKTRKRDALSEIRRLAKAHGLDIAVKGSVPRRRKAAPKTDKPVQRMAGFVVAEAQEDNS